LAGITHGIEIEQIKDYKEETKDACDLLAFELIVGQMCALSKFQSKFKIHLQLGLDVLQRLYIAIQYFQGYWEKIYS
jgi:hypothetical protein